MSRSTLHAASGLVLVSIASLAWADDRTGRMEQGLNHSNIIDRTLVDVVTLPTVNDPASAEMLFKEGTSIVSILDGLKEKGFHIQYKEQHFVPTMTLLRLPQSTRIDELLREILEPWNFRVNRTPVGHWVVRPNKKKHSPAPMDETHEKLREIAR